MTRCRWGDRQAPHLSMSWSPGTALAAALQSFALFFLFGAVLGAPRFRFGGISFIGCGFAIRAPRSAASNRRCASSGDNSSACFGIDFVSA